MSEPKQGTRIKNYFTPDQNRAIGNVWGGGGGESEQIYVSNG